MSTNLVIVAIPEEDDRVWKISSEKVPHLTLLFLGDSEKVANLQEIVQFVEHAAGRSLTRFWLPVDYRGELGADSADVLYFKKGRYDFRAVNDFRNLLLKDSNIRTAYDSTPQFEDPEAVGEPGSKWIPHLTLGYPAAPAKPIPDDQMSKIYDVCFDRVAVWTGDFDGPEFRLKEYMDEMEEYDIPMSAPLSVAMSNLEHHGVKGMRWGVRKAKDTQVTVNGKTKMVTAKKADKLDARFQREAHSVGKYVELHNAAADGVNKEIPAFNKRFEDKYGKEKMDSGVLWNDHDPITKEYHQAYNDMFVKHLNAAAEKMPSSPTGKYKIKIESANGHSFEEFGWSATTEKVRHAADDPTLVTYVAEQDKNGHILSVKLKEDSMAQSEEMIAEFMEHHGVKGMRWGVRKEDIGNAAKAGTGKLGAAARSTHRFVKDVQFESATDRKEGATSSKADERVMDAADGPYHKEDLPAVKARHGDYGKLRNRVKKPFSKEARAYRKDARETYIRRLETEANKMTNASGTRQYTIRERGIDQPAEGGALPKSKFGWEVTARDIKHAAGDAVFNLEVTLDEEGWIESVKPVANTSAMAQSAMEDLGAAFLAHYGVKGMRWGQRKEPVAVAPSARSVVPHGKVRKTKIKTEGGENHAASEDAIRVAKAHAKLKRSGVHALSNQELQDVQTRLNLEQNVQRLTAGKTTIGKGQAFVKGLVGLNKQANDAANTILNTQTIHRRIKTA